MIKKKRRHVLARVAPPTRCCCIWAGGRSDAILPRAMFPGAMFPEGMFPVDIFHDNVTRQICIAMGNNLKCLLLFVVRCRVLTPSDSDGKARQMTSSSRDSSLTDESYTSLVTSVATADNN